MEMTRRNFAYSLRKVQNICLRCLKFRSAVDRSIVMQNLPSQLGVTLEFQVFQHFSRLNLKFNSLLTFWTSSLCITHYSTDISSTITVLACEPVATSCRCFVSRTRSLVLSPPICQTLLILFVGKQNDLNINNLYCVG